MRTRDKLAAEFRKVAAMSTRNGATYEAFAKRAQTGEFDDYADTYVCPITQLHSELMAAGLTKFAARVANGEFDATKEESDEWARSPSRGCTSIVAGNAQGPWLGPFKLGRLHMRDTIENREAIEMMRHCKDEILGLRRQIDHLKPKADAYDNLAIVLGLLPRPSIGMGEDVVWTLDKRIRELTPAPAETNSREAM